MWWLPLDDDELRQMRDEVRCHTAVRAIEDILWRFNEEHEDTLTVYDVLGATVEGLINEGLCPACISESLGEAFHNCGADPAEHREVDAQANTDGNDTAPADDNLGPVKKNKDVLH